MFIFVLNKYYYYYYMYETILLGYKVKETIYNKVYSIFITLRMLVNEIRFEYNTCLQTVSVV
jgi:hypothetical protein